MVLAFAEDNECTRLRYMQHLIGVDPLNSDIALEMVDSWLYSSAVYAKHFVEWVREQYGAEVR